MGRHRLTLDFFDGRASSRSSLSSLSSLGGAFAFPPPFLPLLGTDRSPSFNTGLGFSSFLSAFLFRRLLSLTSPLCFLLNSKSSSFVSFPVMPPFPISFARTESSFVLGTTTALPFFAAWISASLSASLVRRPATVGSGPE